MKSTPPNISVLSLDELAASNTSHRLLDKMFIDPESQESTSSAINNLLVGTNSVNFDLQEGTRTTNSVLSQESISTGSDPQQCNTTSSVLTWSINFNYSEAQASTASYNSLSNTISLSSDSNTNSNIFYPDSISTGSESQQVITSNSTNSNTSMHQQDNSSGNAIISREYIIMPDFCASL